jgi:hypothetical protein
MYVNAVIRSPVGAFNLAEGGPAEDGHKHEAGLPALPTRTQEDAQRFLASLPAGGEYYGCSMHPEVVSDEPGECPLCGMKLEKQQKAAVPAAVASLDAGSNERWAEGYACPMHPNELSDTPGVCRTCNCGMKMQKWKVERVLSVPEPAVIDTGNRKVVYVESAPGVYDAQAVQLGTRVGAYYPVLDGLTGGERVVARGSFLIDAESRLNPETVSVPAQPSGN